MGRWVAATLVAAALTTMGCGGTSRSDDASGGSAPTGSGGATTGGSPSSGGNSGGGGGGSSGSAGSGGSYSPTGGRASLPACPASPPVDAETCEVEQACFYDDCPGEGLTRAACFDSAWQVRTTPCCPESAPATGEACPEGEGYYCYYDSCPGGESRQAVCDQGTWTVKVHACCPAEPPEGDAVGCGADVTEWAGTADQYSCAWKDCASYGVTEYSCTSHGAWGATSIQPCERFFCGDGNTDQNYYCDAGQVCLEHLTLDWSLFECVDNPCAAGLLDVGCLRELCPTAVGVGVGFWGGGMTVSCSMFY